MHASLVIAVSLAVLLGVISMQDPIAPALQDDVTTGTNEVPVTCKTGAGEEGVCVPRIQCDHGTPSIDATIYAPKGYIKICTETDVCCPSDALLPIVQNNSFDKDSIDFDEDD